MDEGTSNVLANVTKSFLGENFSGSMDVSSVKVLSQSVVSSDGRKLKRSGLRKLPQASSSSLNVDLGVEGTVLDWQALETFAGGSLSRGVGESISFIISESISANFDDLTTQLAAASSFFPSLDLSNNTNNRGEINQAIKGPETTKANNNPNQRIIIVTGAAAALVILVGSMFYMERRSGNKRQRTLKHPVEDDEEESGLGYDLKQLSYDHREYKDQSEDSDSACEGVGCVNPAPTKKEKKKQKKISNRDQARMTSLLDNVSGVVYN